MDKKELIGKTVKDIKTGRYEMCCIAVCVEFTDGTSATCAGEHDENTILLDGNRLE